MLQVAARRLADRCPGARIDCLTADAARLGRLCPQLTPLDRAGVEQWALTTLLDRARLPGVIHDPLARRLDSARRRGAGLLRSMMGPLLIARGQDAGPMEAYLEAIDAADLVIGTGGGFLTDPFEHQAKMVLGSLALAQSLGKPTALLGQGIGPIRSTSMREMIAPTLRRTGLIALREDRGSLPLLTELGVDAAHIETTGDDAVEAALAFRPPRLGDGIGVNLRIAGYAGALAERVEVFKSVLAELSSALNAPLVPLPIALQDEDSDLAAIARLMDNARAWPAPDSPDEVMTRAATCRVVMTGSYHAAIFALAQGVPVVGVAASDYYVAKMRGVMGQFPDGLVLVRADEPDLADHLRRAIVDQWRDAPVLRERLLPHAERQVRRGNRAYDRAVALKPRQTPAKIGVWTLGRRLLGGRRAVGMAP